MLCNIFEPPDRPTLLNFFLKWKRVAFIGAKPRVSSMPYLYDIAEGNVSGHFPLHKFGYDPAVGAVLEPIWSPSATPYPYLTAAEKLQVSSADVDDQGSVVISGTATGGSTTTLEDTGGGFVAAVTVGDVALDDENVQYGFVKSITDTILTLEQSWNDGVVSSIAVKAGDAYRVVNANDTGAAVVKVVGQDGTYTEISEFVVLATAADVATANDYLRVYRAYVVHAGASMTNEGIISIEDNASAVVLAQIRATVAQTEMAIWTVPADKTFFCTGIHASETNAKRCAIQLYHRPLGGVFRPIGDTIGIISNSAEVIYQLPLSFKAKSDIELRGMSSVAAAEVYAGFDGWYE